MLFSAADASASGTGMAVVFVGLLGGFWFAELKESLQSPGGRRTSCVAATGWGLRGRGGTLMVSR